MIRALPVDDKVALFDRSGHQATHETRATVKLCCAALVAMGAASPSGLTEVAKYINEINDLYTLGLVSFTP